MPSQTIQSGADTWAREKYPAKTHGAQDFLAIQADPGTGDECQAFIWIRCPAIVGDNVSSAQLVLTASNAGPGQTFTGERITSSTMIPSMIRAWSRELAAMSTSASSVYSQ